jgi:Ni/Co efflux regulator RcnB
MIRKSLIALLLVTSAAPALAAPGDNDRQQWHQRGDGQPRCERDGPDRRKAPENAPAVRQAPDRPNPTVQGRPQRGDDRRVGGWQGRGDAGPQRAPVDRVAPTRGLAGQDARGNWRDGRNDHNGRGQDRRDDNRDWRNDRQGDRQNWRDDRRDDRHDWRDGRRDDRHDGRDNRQGWNGGHGRWDNNWRNDRRYNWQDYRRYNRNTYHLPRYYAPRGYAYRRWSPGYRIDPWFYGQNYWISDPWAYRLPPAYGSYRWVRYYDDVVLIDVRTGLIADIIYSFFY